MAASGDENIPFPRENIEGWLLSDSRSARMDGIPNVEHHCYEGPACKVKLFDITRGLPQRIEGQFRRHWGFAPALWNLYFSPCAFFLAFFRLSFWLSCSFTVSMFWILFAMVLTWNQGLHLSNTSMKYNWRLECCFENDDAFLFCYIYIYIIEMSANVVKWYIKHWLETMTKTKRKKCSIKLCFLLSANVYLLCVSSK